MLTCSLPMVLGILVLGGCAGIVLQTLRSMNIHYDKQPPTETFRSYFHQAPEGVWDLRATGYSSIGGGQAWLRFRVTRSALPTLLHGYQKLTPADAKDTAKSLQEKDSAYMPPPASPDLPEEHRVRWEDIRRIKAPELYHQPQAEYYGSGNLLILDRNRLIVYFYHWNQ